MTNPVRPTLYELKKAALTPRTMYMRHKAGDIPDGARRMLELHYYSKSLTEFLGACAVNPDVGSDFDLDSTSIVVDVGAHLAEWSRRVFERFEPTIYAFEPAPPAIAKLEAGFGRRERVHVLPYGLGRADAEVRIHLAGPGSSIYDAQEGDDVSIKIRDVSRVFEDLGLDQIDVIKINIEGGEYDLIDRLAESGWLARIDHVLVQFHEWHPHSYRRRRRNRRALAEAHDETWCWPWVWERWDRRDG